MGGQVLVQFSLSDSRARILVMGPARVILLLLLPTALFCTGMQGIKLLCPCPELPPSEQNVNFVDFEIFYSIPFSADNPSNVFVESPPTGKAVFGKFIRNGSVLNGLSITRHQDNLQFVKVLSEVSSRDNASLTLKSRVLHWNLKDRLCPDEFVEQVRVWTEGDWVVLWSCYENGLEQDVAILVLVKHYSKHQPTEDELKSLIHKYGGDGLQYPYRFGFFERYGLFYCPFKIQQGKDEDMLRTVTLFCLLFVSLLLVFLWTTCQ